MMIRTLTAAALLSVSTAAHADALLDRLLTESRAVGPNDFAWTRTTRSEQRSGDEVEVHSFVERWDPSRPAAQRWTLVSQDGRAPTADDLKQYAKSRPNAEVPYYGQLPTYLGGKVQRADAAGRQVYRGTGLPKGAMKIGKNDLSASATVEAQVASGPKPFVEKVQTVSNKPFRMMFVVKVNQVETVNRYKLMPDGRPVPAEQVTEMRGSMLGKDGIMRTVITYSDHRAVRPTN